MSAMAVAVSRDVAAAQIDPIVCDGSPSTECRHGRRREAGERAVPDRRTRADGQRTPRGTECAHEARAVASRGGGGDRADPSSAADRVAASALRAGEALFSQLDLSVKLPKWSTTKVPKTKRSEQSFWARWSAYAEKWPEDVKFALDLTDESDRGAVLIASAFAEELLERLLRAACGARADDLLGGHMAPLGTFSAKILATYSLGMLPAYLHSSLEQLRKLRNHCAHHLDGITFSDPEGRCASSQHETPTTGETRPDRSSQAIRIAKLTESRLSAIGKLAELMATLQSWVGAAVPLIAFGFTRKLLQREHDRHAKAVGYGADPEFLFASPTTRPTDGDEPG